jgi:protein tyrosine phosphatase (PTP) superfamily phosphohydrolase (DUF442 family)
VLRRARQIPSLSVALVSGTLSLIAQGCATKPLAAPPVQRADSLASPRREPGIENFAQIGPGLYRGAQPESEAAFRWLEERGVRTVVNLRSYHDDREIYRGTRLRLIHLPSAAWSVGESDLLKFLAVVCDPANQPVFVHCQHGADRTGYAVAGYRMVVDGWDGDSAAAELLRFGFHPIWIHIPLQVRSLDAARIRMKFAEQERRERGKQAGG